MDRDFIELPGVNSPPAPLRPIARTAELEADVKVIFHFDDGFEWLLPGPDECIYHRPRDGYVGISLEHPRAGFRLRSCHFLKALCKDVYHLPIQQLVPNSIRWIVWYIGCSNAGGFQPTFKLFHTLFKLQKSMVSPLYELHFRDSAIGYHPGMARPVVHQNSLKGWHQEFIIVKRGELEYMPILRLEATEHFAVDALSEDAMVKVTEFCGGLGAQMTRDSFMSNQTLFNMGCK